MTEEELTLLALVASYGLQDVEDIRGRKKGKAISGPLSDEELALQFFAEEARALQTLVSDIAFAHSIDEALRTDADLLEEHERAEEVARRDREIARAIAEGRAPTTLKHAGLLSTMSSVRTLATNSTATSSSVISVRPLSTSTVPTASRAPSSSSKQLPSNASVRSETCVICRDAIHGPVIRAPCGDTYDVNCIVDLFRTATVDESLFPPACCRQPFNVSVIRQYLNRDLATLFDKKAVEFGTKDRVYCHRPTCSAFLGAATATASYLTCKECWSNTCGHCKAAAHSLSTRCTSAEDASVVALAEQSGWKRCPGCGHLVELTVGCYHMTCRCRHQFCYLCTARWKTCACTQWDEARLITAAEDRVQRQQQMQAVFAPNVPAPPVDIARAVRDQAARLRENHDCTHRWRYVAGAGRCEGCGHYLRIFLYNCRDCLTWSCARCRRNRWLV
ncbi:hypothetical protein BD311DRAFT_201275 [Dichomitus squalens]|uniref:RBR-type E3 ubiquitin transferase n=1 Tax=Dichomitus squalens TaxID=114155 RepID=A0A4Q9N4B2_9APHY|nr:hypothetical protein BD311DRAFT_201275 [Dichomitus squalens]